MNEHRRLLLYLFVAALLVAGALSLLASSAPDGLERVAADLGFETLAVEAEAGPMSGYELHALGSSPLAQVVAGIAGVLVVLGLAWGLGLLMKWGSARTTR